MDVRLTLLIFTSALAPVLVFAACLPGWRPGYLYAMALAAAAALAAALLASGRITAGLTGPVARVCAALKRFAAADFRLASAIPKEGWAEAKNLTSAANRLMLELSAYRAFQIGQALEERGKAQALIDTIVDGVLLTDDAGRIIYCNQAALRLLGIEKLTNDIVLPASVNSEVFSSLLGGIIASGENYIKTDVAVGVPDEADSVPRSFRVTSRQFFSATLKRPGRVIVIRDITVEKEIESSRETFFHMITHDMRAPLSSIQGYAQMLDKSVGASPEGHKYLQVILRSSKRLNGMIDDILNTIKLERGEMKLNPETIDAGALCSRVLEVHEPLATRRNISFSAVPPSAAVSFTGDELLIDRVITNLVGNALKFTPQGGKVVISCRAVSGEAVFSVEDTGPGIPEDKREEIFKKYSQLEEHKYMGFGLGLAMCKLVVELHKGRIWVESEAGKGSRFSFSVPLAGAADGPG